MTEVYAVHMNRLPTADEFEEMLSIVSEERQTGAAKFRNAEDACRGLIGELLIRAVIRDKLHISNEQVHFVPNRYGKPSLAGYPRFHYNISHSGLLDRMRGGRRTGRH